MPGTTIRLICRAERSTDIYAPLEDLLFEQWPWLIASINSLVATACTYHIVTRKSDVRAAIGWTGLVWLTPVVGALLYTTLGVNRLHRRAVELGLSNAAFDELPLPAADEASRDRLIAEHPTMVNVALLVSGLTGSALLNGNRVRSLVNGDQAFPEMLDAIRHARHSVSLMSYIFDNDRAGSAFVEALCEARARGIAVRVLIDAVGARYSRPSMLGRLRGEGIPCAAFLPTRTPGRLKYSNLRNHCKLLVVDGEVGFTGGTNIREGHWIALEPRHPAQCLHFRLDGPVVAHLQHVFAHDWEFAAHETLQGEIWFPPPRHAGQVWARGIPSGPDADLEKLSAAMSGALSAATRTVTIVTPYFLPDATLRRAMTNAAIRGVDVRIYLPGSNNLPLVAWASHAGLALLLERHVRIFMTPPPFDHSKLMVVDSVWSLIGSANWDPRSLRLNFEFNVECYDQELGRHLQALGRDKEQGSHEVTLEDLRALNPVIRFRNGVARLLSPYL